jgi:hypothetical protein
MCDPRGATAIAPAPQLQQPETSLDVAAPDDCAQRLDALGGVEDGRGPSGVQELSSADPAMPSAAPKMIAPPFVRICAPEDSVRGTRSGARARVDRPPR